MRARAALKGLDIDDPDLPLSRLFEAWPVTGLAFVERKMLCFGCPIAPFHRVEDAVREYGLDEAEFRAVIRAAARSAGGLA